MIAAPIITVDQAADMLGCEPRTLEERLASGEFPGVKYGRSWRIVTTAMLQYLNEEATRNVGRKQPAANAAVLKTEPAAKRPRRGPPTLVGLKGGLDQSDRSRSARSLPRKEA